IASLTGASGASGIAAFQSEQEDGTTKVEFELEIHGADANASFGVLIDGQCVGQIATDQNGEEKLELRNPGNFPAAQNGSAIAVGTILTGTFGTFTDDDGAGDAGTTTNLRAVLTSDDHASGIAAFQSNVEDGSAKVEFEVEIRGAAADTSYDVIVDGQTVGR